VKLSIFASLRLLMGRARDTFFHHPAFLP